MSTIFRSKGKAAPQSQYYDSIELCFQKFEEERKKEEERVQVDEETEKKDLVAGSLATNVTLPELRETLPDLESCVPFAEMRLTPTDAFYCSWMDSCFTCGSSGASDTMMFCVDCGEAYHSFCVNAPIRSMDEYAEAGWRCPNCKVCEISGDVPKDELKMLYCEMCDRAFNLDLLDPPLEAAPSGLWICGQCVECEHCKGQLDPRGISLAHWSSHSEKCYRCGGCDGLIDEEQAQNKCKKCAKLFRTTNEEDVFQCRKCQARVHAACDPRTERALEKHQEHNVRTKKSAVSTRLENEQPRMYLIVKIAIADCL